MKPKPADRSLLNVRLLLLAAAIGLSSCASLPSWTPPTGSDPAVDGIAKADFSHRGKHYRLRLEAKHSEGVEDGSAKVHIDAGARVLRWNPRTERYDIDSMGWVCRADKVFGVSVYNTNQLKLARLAGGESGGASGLKRVMVKMRRIELAPAPQTTADDSMDVTAVVHCDLVSADQYDGDQRVVLQSVAIPLSWHIAVRPETSEGIDVEFRPREKSGRSPMADKQLNDNP